MSNLAAAIEKEGRGNLPAENFGLPAYSLESMQGVAVPTDYEITSVLGDILMYEIVDENESGEVNRGGIWIKQDVTQKMWRVAKVYKAGPRCSDNIKEGDFVMYPSDRGIPMINRDKKKYIFLNEPRIFCVCAPVR